MTQTDFTDNVVIDGSRDITQLKVQGHSTQTEPLQTWENSAGGTQAQITGDGRLTIGDNLTTPEAALVEVHRAETSTTKPRRGMNLLGKINDALSGMGKQLVDWFVSELTLSGSGGVEGEHTAIRSRLTHSNTGDSSSAELRAGDFETINQSGTSGTPVGEVVGVRAAVTNETDAYLTDAIGVQIEIGDEGTLTNAYGLKIEDVNQGSGNNYAIHTGAGKVHIGGETELAQPIDIQGTNSDGLRLRGTDTPNEMVDMYVGSNGNFAIDMTNNADNEAYIDLRPNDNNHGIILRKSDGTGLVPYANFYVTDAADDYLTIGVNTPQDTDALVIAASNQVGIGMLPTDKLSVQGSIRAAFSGTTQAPSGSASLLGTPGGFPGVIIQRGDGSGGIDQRWDFSIKTDDSLEIVDNTDSGKLFLKLVHEGVFQVHGDGGLDIYGPTDDDIAQILIRRGSRNSYLGLEGPGGAAYASKIFVTQFSTGTRYDAIVIENTNSSHLGYVGIGVANPSTRLDVNGTITATGVLVGGAKPFLIDHPLDPENKNLYHAAIEAPRYDLIYRGRVALINGKATVKIDAASNMSEGTFAALTQNPQVWVQNNETWDLVRASVIGGEVHIESNNPISTAVIEWLVAAERADAFVKWHDGADAEGHLIVEQDKPQASAEELKALEDRIDEDAIEDREEDVVELNGKRGYPRHPEAHDLAVPKRMVRADKRKNQKQE